MLYESAYDQMVHNQGFGDACGYRNSHPSGTKRDFDTASLHMAVHFFDEMDNQQVIYRAAWQEAATQYNWQFGD